jgi:hypothetical protein
MSKGCSKIVQSIGLNEKTVLPYNTKKFSTFIFPKSKARGETTYLHICMQAIETSFARFFIHLQKRAFEN